MIDDALRRAAVDRGVSVRLLASVWNHTHGDMYNGLRSLQALDLVRENVHIEVVSVGGGARVESTDATRGCVSAVNEASGAGVLLVKSAKCLVTVAPVVINTDMRRKATAGKAIAVSKRCRKINGNVFASAMIRVLRNWVVVSHMLH